MVHPFIVHVAECMVCHFHAAQGAFESQLTGSGRVFFAKLTTTESQAPNDCICLRNVYVMVSKG